MSYFDALIDVRRQTSFIKKDPRFTISSDFVQ